MVQLSDYRLVQKCMKDERTNTKRYQNNHSAILSVDSHSPCSHARHECTTHIHTHKQTQMQDINTHRQIPSDPLLAGSAFLASSSFIHCQSNSLSLFVFLLLSLIRPCIFIMHPHLFFSAVKAYCPAQSIFHFLLSLAGS